MEGGRNLAAPPVNLNSQAALSSSLLSGSGSYGNAAGGWSVPMAIQRMRLVQRGPAEPNSPPTLRASTLYGPKRRIGKQPISR